jgi:hypothetical protein
MKRVLCELLNASKDSHTEGLVVKPARGLTTMTASASATPWRSRFNTFYAHTFLPEHRVPLNVVLHVLGTVASALLVPLALWHGPLWLLLLFPAVHAAPGLLGHRLFERSVAVGDVRVTRKDYPAWWFIVGNFRMTAQLLTRGFYWR